MCVRMCACVHVCVCVCIDYIVMQLTVDMVPADETNILASVRYSLLLLAYLLVSFLVFVFRVCGCGYMFLFACFVFYLKVKLSLLI